MNLTGWLDAFLRHTRIACRTLARTPMFTLTAVATLALGIGANAAVFSALDAVLLRPLPFPDGHRLMRVTELREKSTDTKIAPPRLHEWNQQDTAFDGITGYYVEDVSESSGDLPERVARATVAPRFFEVWGVPPAIGRGFTSAEHHVGGPAAVVISDRYWRIRLGADPRVLDRTLRIENTTVAIVGVMPASFLFPDRQVDVWSPVHVDATYAQSRMSSWFTGIGRLRPGVTLEQARGHMADVQRRLGELYPGTDAKIGVEIVPLRDTIVGDVHASLWLLFAAVTVLLLITCTNVAALLLSRAAHREREIAIRLSLGATRIAVAAQVLVETIILAAAGAVVGLMIAAGATAALRSIEADLPRVEEIVVNRTILLYTFASALVAALLCGLLPAIRAARHGLGGALSEGSRGQVSRLGTAQWVLVGAQVALSVTLLTGAGLLLRSFQELWRVDPGFEPDRVLTFRVSGSWAETQDMGALVRRFERTLEELRALPGVEAAAMSLNPPGSPTQREENFQLVEARGDTELNIAVEARGVSPAYFDTMRIPVREGEGCRPQVPKTPRDMMVNEAFVSRYLSGYPSPVGLHLSRGPKTRPFRIVGVVGNARERGLDRPPAPTVYWCADWNPVQYFLVRTRDEPTSIARAVRLKIKDLEPLRSVYDISPLTERIDDAFAENRLRTALLALFAMTALSLTCVGLFGTISYVVSQRRREVGLRLALGAVRRDIIVQFVGFALRLVGIACAIGLALSFAFTRTLSGMLYGVSAADPITLAAVVGLVMGVALLAALIPATRAAFVEPMQVLRDE